MDKFDRIFQIHSILANRRTPIDPESLRARLECNRSTMYRLIGEMKDRLGAPIEYDSQRGGFIYKQSAAGQRYELPGLWFSPAELQSLAVMQRMLHDLGGGFLADQLSTITKRLTRLVQHRRLNLGEAARDCDSLALHRVRRVKHFKSLRRRRCNGASCEDEL